MIQHTSAPAAAGQRNRPAPPPAALSKGPSTPQKTTAPPRGRQAPQKSVAAPLATRPVTPGAPVPPGAPTAPQGVTADGQPAPGRSLAAALRWLPALAALALAVCLLCWPSLVFESLLQGFRTAFCQVVPAVFPMMVVCAVVMESPLAAWLGLPLAPYTRLLGIRQRTAATALVLGLLGGFAVLCQGVEQLYRARQIDREQAGLLLAAGLNAGPSFVLLSVGYGMLHSMATGWLLLASLYLGNLLAAALLRFFTLRRKAAWATAVPRAVQAGGPRRGAFVAGMRRAVDACLVLCGYIAFFGLLCALARQLLGQALAAGLCALLEVTNGALFAAASTGAWRVYLVLAALGWAGVSIQLQAKALLSPEISLRSFYLSRPLALLLATALFGAGARLFPQALAASTVPVRASRFGGGVWLSFLLMVGAFLYECTPRLHRGADVAGARPRPLRRARGVQK